MSVFLGPLAAFLMACCRRAPLIFAALGSCDPPAASKPEHPVDPYGRQIVEAASESARQLAHERRLRDIDRLRLEADRGELETEVTALRIWAVPLAALLLAQAVWLAVEIRRRRTLVTIVTHLATLEEKTPENPSA